MDYDIISKEDDVRISDSAYRKIAALDIQRTPVNYELWYAYFYGQNADLLKRINQLTKEKQVFTNELCRDLYYEFIDSTDIQKSVVEETSGQLKDSLADIMMMIDNASNSAKGYNSSLTDSTAKLGSAKTVEDIKAVVQSIVAETKTMMAENKRLEDKLEKSAGQVKNLQETLDNARKEALTDGLTGIANRKCFDEEIENKINDAHNEDHKLCLLVIDIDYFKKFNDNYGHQVGDQVLKLVANTLVNGIKGRDLAARYGGEEFAILLPETPLNAAGKVADGLRIRIANKEIINRATDTNMGQITISVGVAEYQPGEPIEEWIERADKALYKAKDQGRNQVVTADSPFTQLKKQV
ncbi:MAG: GGDEF domain-containing protein [Rickettsiales bacterium]|nr:GGDEF domain-containing protein [Rickettsiales bacterium]|tara:strand:- start:702 stop:1763 length:1062 start_codon:yes stop_codon:yes gene_type:complete